MNDRKRFGVGNAAFIFAFGCLAVGWILGAGYGIFLEWTAIRHPLPWPVLAAGTMMYAGGAIVFVCMAVSLTRDEIRDPL